MDKRCARKSGFLAEDRKGQAVHMSDRTDNKAVGTDNKVVGTVKNMNESVQNAATAVNGTLVGVAGKVADVIDEIDETRVGIGKEMKEGYADIKKDGQKTKNDIAAKFER